MRTLIDLFLFFMGRETSTDRELKRALDGLEAEVKGLEQDMLAWSGRLEPLLWQTDLVTDAQREFDVYCATGQKPN